MAITTWLRSRRLTSAEVHLERQRMDLQLLVVTQLQKTHVIEPHVAGLEFVHGDQGMQSMLRYISLP